MKILIIEDDRRTAEFIEKGLRQEGYLVAMANQGSQGLTMLVVGKYDLAIVDLMLPGLDGLSIVKRVREEGVSTPILILSARDSVDDRVCGLEAGGDDYLVKPFSFSELLARIRALLRRQGDAVAPNVLQIEDLKVDRLQRKVWRGDKIIELQPREFSLLEYLMRSSGRIISKTMIMENVWEYNFDPQTNVVEARICRLRDKIDRGFSCALIHTVRGVGYVLEKR